MSFTKRVTLWCDCEGCDYCDKFEFSKGCSESYEFDLGQATIARDYAKKDGWTNRGADDYCPGCSSAE